MMSVTNPALCRRVTLRHGLAQIPLSILIPYLGVTNWYFLLLSLPVNIYQALLSWEFYRNANANTSKKLFRFTLLHLPIIMLLLIICKNRTGEKEGVIISVTENLPSFWSQMWEIYKRNYFYALCKNVLYGVFQSSKSFCEGNMNVCLYPLLVTDTLQPKF